jgi:hypothetical protein
VKTENHGLDVETPSQPAAALAQTYPSAPRRRPWIVALCRVLWDRCSTGIIITSWFAAHCAVGIWGMGLVDASMPRLWGAFCGVMLGLVGGLMTGYAWLGFVDVVLPALHSLMEDVEAERGAARKEIDQ